MIVLETKYPPKIHNLQKLAEKVNLFKKMSEEQKDIVGQLNLLNIEARYPEYKNRVAANLTNDICKKMIVETEGLLCWIKEQL